MPPRLVEEALRDDGAIARHHAAERRVRLGRGRRRPAARRPAAGRTRPTATRSAAVPCARHLLAQPRHRRRQLARPPRRLADPERDAGRRALRVLDAHAARLDAPDAPRAVAEQEDVAAHALDGEVLVHRADEQPVRLLDHLVVGGVGDRAAAGDGDQARAAARAQPAVARGPSAGGPSAGRVAWRRPRRAARARRRTRRAAGRGTDRRGARARTAPRRRSRRRPRSATHCCARTSRGPVGHRAARRARRRAPRARRRPPAPGRRASAGRGCPSASPRGRAPSVRRAGSAWRARAARRRGTRDRRVPTSIPSSSDAVATTTGTSPDLSFSSASSRVRRAMLP